MTASVKRIAAFADGVLEGNPAGVYHSPEPLTPEVMQSIAAAVGYSETAFSVPLADALAGGALRYAIRYFTPSAEVPLCGHATLATAFALWETGAAAAGTKLCFSAPGGVFEVAMDSKETIWLNFPSDPPGGELPAAEREAVLKATGLREVESVRRSTHTVLVQMADERKVTHYQPSAGHLHEIEATGIIITAAADPGRNEYDFISRFFAPRVGVNEDPVTGLAHTVLGPFWSRRLGRDSLTGYQASDRGGTVRVIADGDRVALGGRARWIR